MAAPVALPSRWRPLHRGGIIRVRLGCGANFEETLMTDYVPGPGDAWERVDPAAAGADAADRKSVVSGKSVSVRVDLGGRRILKKTNNDDHNHIDPNKRSINYSRIH